MTDRIKSYKLSPQLRAELGARKFQKRQSGFEFSLPRFAWAKIPWRAIAITAVIFVVIIGAYLGVKKGYEYTALKSQKAQAAQVAKYNDNLAQIKTEVAAKTTDTVSAVALSQQYLKAGDGERAEAAALIATDKDPAWRDAFVNLGQVYLSINKFNEAGQALNTALKIDPMSGQAHYFLSLVYQELNKADLAKAEFAKAQKFGFAGEIGG